MSSSSSQQDEINKLRNELAMTKQDLQNAKQDLAKAQTAVLATLTFLRSLGGELFRVSMLQSEQQGITAGVIKGIEKAIAVPVATQGQGQQQQQEQGQSQQQQQP